MKKTTYIIVAILILIHCLLSMLYFTNQIPSNEGLNILTQTYSIHYTEGMFDYSRDTMATLVTTMPMRIFENLLSPVFSILFVRLAAFFILFYALRTQLHRNTMLWFSTFYLLGPWLLYSSALQYASFLELGTACYILSVVKMNYYKQIDNNISGQRFWFFLHLISICWCAHFHYCWIVLAITSIILIARNIIRIRLAGLFGALVVIGTTMLPIFMDPDKLPSSYNSIRNTETFGFGLTHVYPILKSVLYWLRFSSTLGINDMLLSTDFSWMSSNSVVNQIIKVIWLSAVYAIGSITLLFSLCSNYFVFKNQRHSIFKRTEVESSTELLGILSFAAILGMCIYAAIAPSLLNSNELIICFDFSLLPILLFLDRYYKTADSYHISMVCATAVFLLFLNIFPAISSDEYSPDGILLERATEINNEQFN